VRRATKRARGGYVPICLCAGAGAGGLLADAIGAGELPIAIVGAVAGYLVSGSILRRIYSDEE
jgi:outer membrane lipoprotein SlyB